MQKKKILHKKCSSHCFKWWYFFHISILNMPFVISYYPLHAWLNIYTLNKTGKGQGYTNHYGLCFIIEGRSPVWGRAGRIPQIIRSWPNVSVHLLAHLSLHASCRHNVCIHWNYGGQEQPLIKMLRMVIRASDTACRLSVIEYMYFYHNQWKPRKFDCIKIVLSAEIVQCVNIILNLLGFRRKIYPESEGVGHHRAIVSIFFSVRRVYSLTENAYRHHFNYCMQPSFICTCVSACK